MIDGNLDAPDSSGSKGRQLMPRPWLFWTTLFLAAAGLGVTSWLTAPFINVAVGVVLILMTAAVVSPWATARLRGSMQWSASLGVLALMWLGWMYFFDVLLLFTPAAVFSTWWAVGRRKRSPRPARR
jgi:hypothetical protein